MGKRMFDADEQAWPEEAAVHTPVFVVTHQEREPWERRGDTTFYFGNDGIESAPAQAREAAGEPDADPRWGAAIVEYRPQDSSTSSRPRCRRSCSVPACVCSKDDVRVALE